MSKLACPKCLGQRLKLEALSVYVGGKSIWDVVKMSIEDCFIFFSSLKLKGSEEKIALSIVKEVKKRLNFCINVGLSYLSLNRLSSTLSGGEAQRIRLATQVGSSLSGVIYILDEPSIGLHQRDNLKLIKALKNLRDIGNSVIVVEHDKETILAADHIIDIGPGAGRHGGEIVAEGTPELIKNNGSITADYLVGKRKLIFLR